MQIGDLLSLASSPFQFAPRCALREMWTWQFALTSDADAEALIY
jgi:hypothetical protein